MDTSSRTPSENNSNDDRATRLAFNFFIGMLGITLLAALWMLIDAALL